MKEGRKNVRYSFIENGRQSVTYKERNKKLLNDNDSQLIPKQKFFLKTRLARPVAPDPTTQD